MVTHDILSTITVKTKKPFFGEYYTCFGDEAKTGVVRTVLREFFNIHLCSATSIESSRRDPLNDVAEHRSILKTNQNT